METPSIPAWVFTIEPYEGESLSHFLGRFRRANFATVNELGQKTGLGVVLGRWEKFRFMPPPSDEELTALAAVVQVNVARLKQMLPPKGVGMKLEPIRLCAACYGDVPYHRIEWQFKSVWKCDRHQLKLLSKCPHCGAKFKVPALWNDGVCSRCHTPFGEMAQLQKAVD